MPSAAPDPLSSDVSTRHGSEGWLDFCRLRFDFDFVVMLLPRIDPHISSRLRLPVELFGTFPEVVCSFAARPGVTCPHDLCLGQMRARVDCQLFVCRRHTQLQILSDHGKLAAPETLRYLARLRVAPALCHPYASALILR